MPRKRLTPTERVREARLALIDGLVVIETDAPPDPEFIRAFRELCDAALEEARRDVDEAGIEALSERLQALIAAHNQLSDIVNDHDTRLRQLKTGRSQGLRMG